MLAYLEISLKLKMFMFIHLFPNYVLLEFEEAVLSTLFQMSCYE